jgi:hypothetical protein
MKTNPTAHRAKRRGRKKGGDVLKEINPQGSAAEHALKFAYGRHADDAFSELVRVWRRIHRANEDLARRATRLGHARIGAAEAGHGNDKEALRYWQDKRQVQRWLDDQLSNLTIAVRANMELGQFKDLH